MANIAEILKNAPKGLKLYSPVYGEVELVENDGSMLSLKNPAGIGLWLDGYGKKSEEGECLLFPSKDHRTWEDWEKALIPKCVGSVIISFHSDFEWLVTMDGMFAINMNDDETYLHPFNKMCYDDFVFANSTEIGVFFKRLDKLGYKFENGEVVKKEKEWCIFDAKDGDFVYDSYNGTVFIFKEINSQKALMEYVSYPSLLDFPAQMKSNGIQHSTLGNYYDEKQYRLATTEELQLLLGKLNDSGYYWDYDRKIISRIHEEPEKIGETFDKYDYDWFVITDDCDFPYYQGGVRKLHKGDIVFSKPSLEEGPEYMYVFDEHGDWYIVNKTLVRQWNSHDAKDGDLLVLGDFVLLYKNENYNNTYITVQKDQSKVFTGKPRDSYEAARLASSDEKKWFDKYLEEHGYYFDPDRKVLCMNVEKPDKENFTIDDFKPFDKVLVRDRSEQYWNINLFSHYDETSDYPYRCLSCDFAQCVPYNEETAYLLRTEKNYDGKYKTWED